MRTITRLGAGLAALFVSTTADAHHPGGAGNVGAAGPINTISASTLGQGQSAAAIMFEMIKIDPFSDAQLADFAGKHIHAHSLDAILVPSLAFAYGITNDLMISARLPYVIRKDIREGAHHHVHGGGAVNEVVERGDADGIGDLTTMLQWRVLNNRETGTEAALLGGAKAPTGAHDRVDRGGEIFELEFQPGSGSWDWMIGAALTQRAGRWSFDANALYTFAGDGALDTNLGDRFQYNLAVSWRVVDGGGYGRGRGGHMHLGAPLPEPMYHGAGRSLKDDHIEPVASVGPSLDLVLELNGERHARQIIAGVEDENSGGTTVYLAPGARLSGDRWSTFVSVGVPIVNNLYGTQAEPDYRIVTGFGVSF